MTSPQVPMPQSPPELSVPFSAATQRQRFAKAYSILQEAIDCRAFPGAAFSVLAHKEILALDGVGSFTYEAGSTAVGASTVYDLASVTKVLATTSMAMLLYQRGKLQLDEPLAERLPAFTQGEPPGGPRHKVTLRLLLAHASGLPGYVRLFETCHDRRPLIDACLRLPLEASPGARSEYSDPGFILLGQALESIAAESIDQFCAREIFDPLGMSSTRYLPPAEWARSIPPTQEDRTLRHRIVQGEVQDENCFVMGGVSGHTGLFANALDLLRYARCILNSNGEPSGSEPAESTRGNCSTPLLPDVQLFARETVDLFTRRTELPPGSSRALGWDTPSPPSSSGKFFSRHSAGHLGYAGTSMWIDLERRLAIVLLTNRTWPHRESQAIREIRPVFHDAVMTAVGDLP
jgi:serine-type D-Ala-D-Ala carboxypeptidase